MSISLLSRRPVCGRTGDSKSTHYSNIQKGLMTPPVKYGRSSRWPDYEVDRIIAARIAGKSEEEIRALVTRLVAERQELSDEASP